MNRDEFQALTQRHFDEIIGLNDTKGHEYAGDEDALANFKQIASETGINPIQVWNVYATKHWKAIQSFVREGRVHSEPIEGRLHDVILYCFLLIALAEEGDTGRTREMAQLNPDAWSD